MVQDPPTQAQKTKVFRSPDLIRVARWRVDGS